MNWRDLNPFSKFNRNVKEVRKKISDLKLNISEEYNYDYGRVLLIDIEHKIDWIESLKLRVYVDARYVEYKLSIFTDQSIYLMN